MDCPICHKSFASRYSRERHAKLAHPDTSGIAMKVENYIKEEPDNNSGTILQSALSNPETTDDDGQDTDSEDEKTQSTDVDMDTQKRRRNIKG